MPARRTHSRTRGAKCDEPAATRSKSDARISVPARCTHSRTRGAKCDEPVRGLAPTSSPTRACVAHEGEGTRCVWDCAEADETGYFTTRSARAAAAVAERTASAFTFMSNTSSSGAPTLLLASGYSRHHASHCVYDCVYDGLAQRYGQLSWTSCW